MQEKPFSNDAKIPKHITINTIAQTSWHSTINTVLVMWSRGRGKGRERKGCAVVADDFDIQTYTRSALTPSPTTNNRKKLAYGQGIGRWTSPSPLSNDRSFSKKKVTVRLFFLPGGGALRTRTHPPIHIKIPG